MSIHSKKALTQESTMSKVSLIASIPDPTGVLVRLLLLLMEETVRERERQRERELLSVRNHLLGLFCDILVVSKCRRGIRFGGFFHSRKDWIPFEESWEHVDGLLVVGLGKVIPGSEFWVRQELSQGISYMHP